MFPDKLLPFDLPALMFIICVRMSRIGYGFRQFLPHELALGLR